MRTASDYRIENIREATVDGEKVKTFDAWLKWGNAFVFLGAYKAPLHTASKDLWLIPNRSDAVWGD